MFQKFVMPVIRQITLVRFAGLAAMSLMFVLFNLKFSFIMNFHDTVECIKGTANGVLFPLEPHPYDLSSLEKAVINFGQASAALYGAVLALGLSVVGYLLVRVIWRFAVIWRWRGRPHRRP